MRALSLKTKFTFMGLAVLLGVLALAYTGYTAVDRLLRLAQLEVVTSAIRHHMELDMMHDAIHGDALNGIAALQNKNGEQIDKVKEALKEHLGIVEENFKAIGVLDLAPDIVESYKALTPEFENYQKSASELLDILAKDNAHGTNESSEKSKQFEAQFEKLEGVMSETSDKVQAWSKQIKDDGLKTATDVREQIMIVLSISILLALLAPIYARFSLFRGIAGLEDVANRLANEEYDVDIYCVKREDEIGNLARVLEKLRVKAAEAFTLKRMVDDMPLNIMTADPKNEFKINYANNSTRHTLQKLQRLLPVSPDEIIGKSIDIFHKNPGRIRELLSEPKNLPHQAKINLGDEVLDLKISAIRDAKGSYVGPMVSWAVVTQNVQLADTFEQSIGAVSEQISTSATSLNQGAVSLQAAIEELSATAVDISKRVHESMNTVRQASEKGVEAQASMQNLSMSADKVSGVVTLIQQIAEKINLLALNATIESARAGEAGKGFAVVANEVKNLATQTANAITEISKQVGEMHSSADQAVTIVKDITQAIQAVNQFASDVSTAVEQQQASTSEIAKNICGGDAKSGACEKTSVLGLAAQLTSVSGELKKECAHFLDKVRKM